MTKRERSSMVGEGGWPGTWWGGVSLLWLRLYWGGATTTSTIVIEIAGGLSCRAPEFLTDVPKAEMIAPF